MMNTNKKAPKLRFKGFTDDWEQHKLSEITARVTRKNGSQSDLPLTISAQDGLVDQRKYFNRQVASRDMSNYYLIKKGEFAYNKSYSEGYPFGAVKRLDYYDMGALSTLYILFEITDKNISSDFIVSYYMTHLWHKEISKQAAEGARNHGLLNISTEDFFDSELNIPNSIEEQVKIGNFIKQFDKFINLYQRKLDKMKLNKRVLLQKLFPQNGCTIPEVRFKGFTDAWEQRKLSDISTKVTTKNVDVHYTETLTNSAEQGIISQVDFFDKEISNKDNINGYYIVENNDFIYNPRISTLAPVGPINRNKLNRTGIMSPLYTVFRSSNIDLDFLEWYFQSSHWHRYMKLNGDSGARADRIAIKDSTFFDMPIKTPVNIKEQVLIGETLEKFNQYITLHQCKLDRLISIKKALLQQLFV